MKSILVRFWRDEDGLETVEWAVIAAVITVGAVAAFRTLGGKVSNTINGLANNIS